MTAETETLKYKYRGDPTIGIGVPGMIDNNFGISECGRDSAVKNAVLNSFVEAQRLELHKDKAWLLILVVQTNVTNPIQNSKFIQI